MTQLLAPGELGGPTTAAPAAGNTININLRAFSDRFSIRQVMDDLALHGVV